MENKKTNLRFGIWGLAGVILLTALDQLTKYLAVIHLAGKEAFVLIPGVFELRYLENRGAAFGILQNKQIFFVLLTAAYLCLAIWIYFRIPREKKYRLLHCIDIILTAGALGNLIDRLMNGYVVDFFYFSLIDFPIFNVADIYVTAAVVLLIIALFFVYKEEDLTFLNRKKKEN